MCMHMMSPMDSFDECHAKDLDSVFMGDIKDMSDSDFYRLVDAVGMLR